MKRRSFGLLATTSLLALTSRHAFAQTGPDPSLLKTILTPVGAERAGNADGSIPPWTGGYTTIPDGWTPGSFMPDPFIDDEPVVVINSSNLDQYSTRLTDGLMTQIKTSGMTVKVYPTHRSAAQPQANYENIASNIATATLDPNGGRLGFSNAFGGIPFPIPDASDPLMAGAQIMWNHVCRWQGWGSKATVWSYVVSGANAPVLASMYKVTQFYPFYSKGGSYSVRNDRIVAVYLADDLAPPNINGEEIIAQYWLNPAQQPTDVWELLQGQGRVRRAPELSFDTPSFSADGIANFDEYYGFIGSLEKYDWKLIGKKEIYIPYHNNTLVGATAEEIHTPNFLNPELIRYELHRVWVVEATLHPGERNVLARRRYYLDEDTWTIAYHDAWDANNNLVRVDVSFNFIRPDLPGTIYVGQVINNLQAQAYVTVLSVNEKAKPSWSFYDTEDIGLFDPNNMAASAQY